MCFQVTDTQKQGNTILHSGVLIEGNLKVGATLKARVDEQWRLATVRNHSATHLLHAALRRVLGDHVAQKGSLVEPQRLRFDFSHDQPLTDEQLVELENLVNAWVLANEETQSSEMALDDALNSGVLFKIVSETGTASGVRRITALTGEAAIEWMRHLDQSLLLVADRLKTDRDGVDAKLSAVLNRSREVEKELERLKTKLANTQGGELADQAVVIEGFKVLAARVEGADAKTLRESVDNLKAKLGTAVIVLAAVNQQKVSLVAGVTKEGVERLPAGTLVNFVAEQVGGRGGGRADLAQAGGNEPSRVDEALASVPGWVIEQLS